MAQPAKKPSALDKLKKALPADSLGGKLRDRDKNINKALRDAGVAKNDRTSAKPKQRTRLA